MRPINTKWKALLLAAAGYAVALLTSGWVPEAVSLLLPVLGAAIGLMGKTRSSNLPREMIPAGPETGGAPALSPQGSSAAPAALPGDSRGRQGIAPGSAFAPVVEYLVLLEDMMISEGQKNTLDHEIVEKSLALFARLQRVLPLLEELNNGDINHTVRRLIMKDLNGLINPFLRLSGEAKSQNRRMLLNGLRDIDAKITDIASTIEHKDLLELQNKAELIHQRYNSSEL